MKQSKPPLWTKDYILMFLATFLVFFIFYLLMNSLAVYAMQEFNVEKSMAGLAAGMFVIGGLFCRPFTGKYIEYTGCKKMVVGSLIVYFLASLFYFAAKNLVFLLIIRLIHGAAFGASATAMAAAVAATIPRERFGEGLSYFTLSMSLATAIGPFFSMMILSHYNFTILFMICSTTAAIALLSSLFSTIPDQGSANPQSAGRLSFKLSDFYEIKVIPICIVIFILCLGYAGLVSFLTVFAQEIDLMQSASFFFIFYALATIISRLITGPLYDKKGENFLVYPLIICYALGLLLFSQAGHGITLLAAAVLIGAGFGSLYSVCQAITVQESPKQRVGVATATYFSCVDGSLGIGPFLLGLLVPLTGFRGVFLTLAIVVLAMILLYYLLHGKKAASKKKQPSQPSAAAEPIVNSPNTTS